MQNSMVMITSSILEGKPPFWKISGSKNQICQFIMKVGT